MKEELANTKRWETQWKIVTNPNKIQLCSVGCLASSPGAINIGGTLTRVWNSVTILGYEISSLLNSTLHITKKTNMAKAQLARLYRFHQAPPHIKLHLYKMIIRPILEYPCTPLTLTNKTNMVKLQRVQNKALRFTATVSLRDRVRSSDLHTRFKLLPLNQRLHNLSVKQLLKMKDMYIPNREDPFTIYNTTNYEIQEPPHRTRRMSLQQKVRRHIHVRNYPRPRILSNLPTAEEWEPPAPRFTYGLPKPIYHGQGTKNLLKNSITTPTHLPNIQTAI
ncbi:RNA-directed DNA polymerase from mobile element jockey [Astathelohania contejeani]|uniref:RNA-directed DNA polymerase from mobile element jockey n=1 Tax=Astathelohania contejeani TaxID=164912 RepID=A0ABQ7HVD5_9MICR|nr:RNA-directed DNA polymerase from mobile element jockey [Thelohania contejeani]